MATHKSRLLALEAQRLNQKKDTNDLAHKAELEASSPMVKAYFESNGCKLDTLPRADFTKVQCDLLAAYIKFYREYM